MEKKEKFIAAIKEKERFIYKIASLYTNNSEDKKDLVQEIFYQLWKSFDTFNQKSSFSTWVYRVALNVAIYQLKISKKRIVTVPIDEQVLEYPNNGNTENEEKWNLFKQQIDKLNLLDKGIEEIGEIIGITTSNVGTKLSRIKEKLKQQIFKQL